MKQAVNKTTKYSAFLIKGTNHINTTNEHTHIKKTDKPQPSGNITFMSYLKNKTGDNLALLNQYLQLMSAHMGGMKASYC